MAGCFFRLHSAAWLTPDIDAFRLGYVKTPVGFEGLTGSEATTFLEVALPVRAIFAGRRMGVGWTVARRDYLVSVGYYAGGDLQGDADGHMVASRVVLSPAMRRVTYGISGCP